MEKAFGQARDSANRHKGEMDKYASSSNLDPKPDRGHSGPRHGKPSLAQAQAKSQASDKSLKNATSLHAKPRQPGIRLKLFGFEQESVGRKLGGTERPERRTSAKRNFEASTQDASRWQAELVNAEATPSSTTPRGLESELGELKDLLTEAEGFRNSAMQAVQAASESLRLVPEKDRPSGKVGPGQAGKVKSLETNKSAIVEAKEKKTAFIKNADQLALWPRKKPKPSKTIPSLLRRMPSSKKPSPF